MLRIKKLEDVRKTLKMAKSRFLRKCPDVTMNREDLRQFSSKENLSNQQVAGILPAGSTISRVSRREICELF